MYLINVQFLLDFEEKISPHYLRPLVEFTGALPEYAILSHCWGSSLEEVQFEEMQSVTAMNRDELCGHKRYQKILRSCQQAREDGLLWVWVDTCCIDKRSSSELSEAINSMYQWYAKSKRCYVYLHDVHTSEFPRVQEERLREFNGWPKWFSRGWTLQELVAPSDIHFFNREWSNIGTKNTLTKQLSKITRIPDYVLTDGLSSHRRSSVAQIMSWAADRRTTREEDRAYSLLGMLGVQMPMLYGEGKDAFRRLQEEIIKRSNDQTIFAWGWSAKTGWSKNFLADDPSYFLDCDKVVAMKVDEFVEALSKEIPREELNELPLEHLRTFTLSNNGIQIWLPIIPCRWSARLYKSKLSCCIDGGSSPISIVLGYYASNYFRYLGDFEADSFARMRFRQVFLPYQENVKKDDFTFHLELRPLTTANFRPTILSPRDVQLSGTSVTLSKTSDYAILGYYRPDGVHLTVVLRHCLGGHSIQVTCERSKSSWLECARRAYQRTQDETLTEAFHISEALLSRAPLGNIELLKCVHIPRSIYDVRLLYSRALQLGSCTVTADVVECTGRCKSAWDMWDGNFVALPHIPGFMREVVTSFGRNTYEFQVNSHRTRFRFSNVGSTIELGDYGRMAQDGFLEREGNIFELATMLGLKILHRHVELGIGDGEGVYTEDDSVKVIARRGYCDRALVLRNATAWSLPTTEDVFSLIATLSVHLLGRCLVTTVIQYSETYYGETSNLHYENDWLAYSWPACIRDLGPWSSRWEKHLTPSNLYTLMTPLAWHRTDAHKETSVQFQKLNKHIDYLLMPDAKEHEVEELERKFQLTQKRRQEWKRDRRREWEREREREWRQEWEREWERDRRQEWEREWDRRQKLESDRNRGQEWDGEQEQEPEWGRKRELQQKWQQEWGWSWQQEGGRSRQRELERQRRQKWERERKQRQEWERERRLEWEQEWERKWRQEWEWEQERRQEWERERRQRQEWEWERGWKWELQRVRREQSECLQIWEEIPAFTDVLLGKSLKIMIGDIFFLSELASLVTSTKVDKPTHGNNGLGSEGVNSPTRPCSILRRPLSVLLGVRSSLRLRRPTQISTANLDLSVTRVEADSLQDSHPHVMKRTLTENSICVAVKIMSDLTSTPWMAARQASEELRSESFGPQLLLLFGTIYMKSREIFVSNNSGSDSAGFAVVYPTSRLRALLGHVHKLRSHLQAAENDEEVQWALKEDIAGTILLLYWQGIRCEVEQVLVKIVNAVVNDKSIDYQVREARAERLRNVGEMLVQSATDCVLGRNICPLQRALTDAEAGVSKYDLLLAARKARSELLPGLSSC